MTDSSLPIDVLKHALSRAFPPPASPPVDPPDCDVIATTIHGRHASGLLVVRVAVMPFRDWRPQPAECVEFETLTLFPPRTWLARYLGPTSDAPELQIDPTRFSRIDTPLPNAPSDPADDTSALLPSALDHDRATWPRASSRRAATAFHDDLQGLASIAVEWQRTGRLLTGHQSLGDALYVLALLPLVGIQVRLGSDRVIDTGLIAKAQRLAMPPESDESLLAFQCRIAGTPGPVPALEIDVERDRPEMPSQRSVGQMVPSRASMLASAGAVEFLKQWTVALGD